MSAVGDSHPGRTGPSPVARRAVLVGWVANGVVYLAVAWIVVQMALGQSKQEANMTGALQYIGNTPVGGVALIVLGVGLLAFALGRILEVTVLATPEVETSDKAKAVLLAAIYVFIAISAFSIGDPIGGKPVGVGGAAEQRSTGFLLGLPGGQFIVVAAGVALAAVGVREIVRGVGRKFLNTLRTSEMAPAVRRVVAQIGVLAYITKGLIFFLLGYFLFRAGLLYRPRHARDLDAALRDAAQADGGTAVLIATAIGLVAYAVFCLLEARYRRIGVSATGTAG